MNLTLAELGELPLGAALLDTDGGVIAATPEWPGRGPGTVVYALRATRLAVATAPGDRASDELLDRLLGELRATEDLVPGVQRLRVGMLAASLRMLAGRAITGRGTSHDAIDLAVAGITARTSLAIRITGRPAFAVRAPEVIALCLVQLAVNAERHARTSSVTLLPEAGAFTVAWPGEAGRRPPLTSRLQADRQGWGLGFCRIAADTLGATLHPPADRGDGSVSATLELGARDLALPLAAVRGGRVLKATRTWDEETGSLPRSMVPPGSRLALCVQAAAAEPGRVVGRDGWTARLAGERTWVAIPPDGVRDRARDVLQGMAHERALWEGVPEPRRTRVHALVSLLGARLGTPVARVPALAWNRQMARLAPAMGLGPPVPAVRGLGGLDPQVAAYLAAELGAGFEVRGEELMLRVRPDRADDARLAGLPRRDGGVLLT